MQWFLFRRDSFAYSVLEYKEGDLIRKISFHDDRGLPALSLINEAQRTPDEQQTTIQQIIKNCRPVKL